MTVPDPDFDPSVAYCINGCGNLAFYEELTGVVADGDDVVPVYELSCGDEACVPDDLSSRSAA